MCIGSSSLALGGRVLQKNAAFLDACGYLEIGFGASLVVICETLSLLVNIRVAKKGLLSVV